MRQDRPYSNIPGTYVLDPQHSMQGYELNMFCMSLNKPQNRDKFRLDEEAYLDDFPLTKEQRKAVLSRDWLGLLQLGGNIYYTFKLASSTVGTCSMLVVLCRGLANKNLLT